MNAHMFNFTDYVLLAYSSLSRYQAYETLTDKTKLKYRNYQENSRLHDKKLEAAKYLPYNNELIWIKDFQ